MENFNTINGSTVTATDVRKSWTKIVKAVKETKKPAYVYTNNKPEAVVLSISDYETLAKNAELGKRKQLEEELERTYMEFLSQQGLSLDDLPKMRVAEDGVFYEVVKDDK